MAKGNRVKQATGAPAETQCPSHKAKIAVELENAPLLLIDHVDMIVRHSNVVADLNGSDRMSYALPVGHVECRDMAEIGIVEAVDDAIDMAGKVHLPAWYVPDSGARRISPYVAGIVDKM